MDEELRLEIIRNLKEAHPHLDIDAMLAGELAGPASPDRPPVPVWEYLEYAVLHELSDDEVAAIRFPVVLPGGHPSVTSIAEYLAPPPAHLRRSPARRFDRTVREVVERWAFLHEVGAVEWDATSRSVVHVGTMADYRTALAAWSSRFPSAGATSG